MGEYHVAPEAVQDLDGMAGQVLDRTAIWAVDGAAGRALDGLTVQPHDCAWAAQNDAD